MFEVCTATCVAVVRPDLGPSHVTQKDVWEIREEYNELINYYFSMNFGSSQLNVRVK
jgi:hypothetical protein